MISLEDVHKNFIELTKKNGPDPSLKTVTDHLLYLSDNYKNLDPEAKLYTDQKFDKLSEVNAEIFNRVKQMPDNLENRKLIRSHLGNQGSHFKVVDLLSKLETPPNLELGIIQDGRKTFCTILQPLLNYLCDIHQQTLPFNELVILALVYACIEELVIAMHLAQHNYLPQSSNHSRIAIEITQKIELFIKNPGEVNTWFSNDPKTIRNKFGYKKIRMKLGKIGEDPNYHLLSDLGIHGDLNYLKSKIKIELKDKNKVGATITMGGSNLNEDLITVTQGICINTVGDLFGKVISKFGIYLLDEEIIQDYDLLMDTTEIFLAKYFYPACEKKGIDTTGMKEQVILYRKKD